MTGKAAAILSLKNHKTQAKIARGNFCTDRQQSTVHII